MAKSRAEKGKAVPMEKIREAGLAILPRGAGWVAIKGNPYAPRGRRLPNFGSQYDIQHLDVYWAHSEEVPWKLPGGRRNYDDKDGHELAMLVCNGANISTFQLTWATIVTPYAETFRFYGGELALFSEELIGRLLDEGGLETISFVGATHPNPVWDEAVREIVDALQVDGLSFQAAQAEVITCGLLEIGQVAHPNWFYRPTGWYKELFSEESLPLD